MTNKNKTRESFRLKKMRLVVDYFGSQSQLSERLGVSRQYIEQLVTGKRHMPIKYALLINKLSNGQFKAFELVNEEDQKYVS